MELYISHDSLVSIHDETKNVGRDCCVHQCFRGHRNIDRVKVAIQMHVSACGFADHVLVPEKAIEQVEVRPGAVLVVKK